jgi:hypothetical protein
MHPPNQQDLCRRYGVMPDYVNDFEKVGIALATLQQRPLNGLRHPRDGDTCGWYIWGGPELSTAADFFQPLHVKHLVEICPRALDFLALPAGWRFLTSEDYVDVWHDSSLLIR